MNSLINTAIIFYLLSGPLFAQKPTIQVSFTIDQGNPFYDRYEEDILQLQADGLDTILLGLRRFIGFADFVDSSASHQLSITLSRKFAGPIASEYYLIFDFRDEQGNQHTHQWKFLSFGAFTSLGTEVQQVLQKLSLSWKKYLEGHYNQDLVVKLFQRVALPLPDSTHYFIDPTANIQEAILPFAKEDLRMDPQESEFKVLVIGQLPDGTPTQDQQNAATFSGDVESSMANVPNNLLGCMRIKLQSLPMMRLLNGKVFVTKYQWKLYEESSSPNDFLNGI